MKKKDVSIRLISRQSDGEKDEEMELYTKGTYEKTGEGYLISYEESEATGMEGSSTRFETFGGSRVNVSRSGEITTDMMIELGTKHHCIYGTPYGSFTVGVEARTIKDELTDEGGSVAIHYVVDVNSTYLGDFRISLDVTPDDPGIIQ